MPGHSNHLIHETSPYLLQHAHNPVDWYPWGEEALKRATTENKPILVSIGYAACHWCHVMERESFEDESTAAIMNSNFINIKIDREERPDLDHIYMDAVQAMTGSGGWPLNVFLTPDARPFYGGTYFPPKRAFNRPSWQEVLLGVVRSFKEKRNEIDQQAEGITGHLMQSNDFGLQAGQDMNDWGNVDELYTNLMKNADKEWGGFGHAPKFPQTGSILYLLRYHYLHRKDSQTTSGDEAIRQALLSIDKMIQGGIYDQLGGGFARYSTDDEWLAPHFEKMLYDNALLLMVLSEAYQITGEKAYEEVIHQTMQFIQREMTFVHSSGKIGFYSALDADSEGEEGKFYVWQQQEVREILGEDASIFCEYYDISTWGNWEGKNILRIKVPFEKFCADKKIEKGTLKKLLGRSRQKLLLERAKRIRPSLDDKIILGWNALMNMACSKAFAATGNETYRITAIDNMEFLLSNFNANGENELNHTWKNERAKFPAFLDDHAFLILALIHLQEITGDTKWLDKAVDLTTHVIDRFSEDGSGFFYYTPEGQPDVIIRKKEVYDGAVPSGNSVMATNLYKLAMLTDRNSWKEQSFQMVGSLGKAIVRYPTSFANWGCLVQEMVSGTEEIVITGKEVNDLHLELLKKYIPHRVLMVTSTIQNSYPLLAGKPVSEPSQIWRCRNFKCLAPVTTVKALISLIDSEHRAD